MKKSKIAAGIIIVLIVIGFFLFYCIQTKTSGRSNKVILSYEACVIEVSDTSVVCYTLEKTIHAGQLIRFCVNSNTVVLDKEGKRTTYEAISLGQICDIEVDTPIQYLGLPQYTETTRIKLLGRSDYKLFLEGMSVYAKRSETSNLS